MATMQINLYAGNVATENVFTLQSVDQPASFLKLEANKINCSYVKNLAVSFFFFHY